MLENNERPLLARATRAGDGHTNIYEMKRHPVARQNLATGGVQVALAWPSFGVALDAGTKKPFPSWSIEQIVVLLTLSNARQMGPSLQVESSGSQV